MRLLWQAPETSARARRFAGSLNLIGSSLALATVLLLAGGAPGHAEEGLVEAAYPAPFITTTGTEVGLASWYGPGFHGRATAGGERYDQESMTAAHRSLPLGTVIEVTSRDSGRTVRLRVNDRGPYHPDRALDLSRAAADALGAIERGVVPVEIRVIWPQYATYPVVRYAVQLGAFGKRERAESVAWKLRRLGARVSTAGMDPDGEIPVIYRVRVGSYTERGAATRMVQSLRGDGFTPFVVEITPRPVSTRPPATADTNPT